MTIGKLSGQCDFGQKGQSYCNQRGQSCVAKRVKVAWLFHNQLYRYDDNFGWTHRYLTIREQGALLALNDLPAVTRETIARYLILQHTSLERQQKLFYCRESFLKQEYKLRLTPTELLELSLSLLASGKLEGDSKSVTQIGTVRFLADCLGLDFPANYDSLMYQLKEREQLTKFMDELRQSLIAYLRKKNG